MLLATISPIPSSTEETLQTLQYVAYVQAQPHTWTQVGQTEDASISLVLTGFSSSAG